MSGRSSPGLGRDLILRAARELYLEVGLEALSMRRLAARLGVTAPALYRHYPDKATLLQGLVDEANAILGRCLGRALRARSPRARLLATARAYADFALENPEDYAVLFLSRGRSDMDLLPGELRSANFRFALERVGEAIAAGDLSAGDPVLVTIGLWAQWHGLVALHRAGRFGDDDEVFRRVFAHALERSLKPA